MGKMETDKTKIEQILERGVITDILPSKAALVKEMTSGRKLRFYHGMDPTGASLHLSHAKNYILLEEIRKLGHEVILLIGDFTARVGDPSDKSATRKRMGAQEIKENVEKIIRQLTPIMDFKTKGNPPKLKYNSEWLQKLNFEDLLSVSSNFTVQQIIERDMFQRRIKNDKPIHLHEFLYPLMQGYDSVAMDVDVEVGGTDQLFNMLAGRTLMKRIKDKEKFVIAVNLMANPKTGELMSMSKGTGVFIDTSPDELYGQVMAQPDEMIEQILLNCTRVPMDEIEKLNITAAPLEAKKLAAKEVVKVLHGEQAADIAQKAFSAQFIDGELPGEIPEVSIPSKNLEAADLLVETKLAASKSDARRLLEQGGVRLNSKAIKGGKISVKPGDVVQVGKRKFVKVK